uniref:Ion channel n=1 Tax=Heterorhabditis bacteriophora TaxID=37862 RepID=A0A1I7XHY0_HETBA
MLATAAFPFDLLHAEMVRYAQESEKRRNSAKEEWKQVADTCVDASQLNKYDSLVQQAFAHGNAESHLESIGFRVGYVLAEKASKESPKLQTELEVVKFICKEFWSAAFGKQVDNLRTNHQGVYVVQDNKFCSLTSLAEGSQFVKECGLFLSFPSGMFQIYRKIKWIYQKFKIRHAKEALFWFLDHLNLAEVIDERTDDTPWTWLGSMFYAGQLYTTIGYGYPTTRTTGGRVASIIYILIGIPIFLIILKDIGSILSRALRKLYKRLRTSKRRIAETTPIKRLSLPSINIRKSEGKKTSHQKKEEKEDELRPEQQNQVNARLHAENAFPIPIALSILFLWILFSAALFCIWEKEWGFMTSVYFFFVSISTVGLGDIVFSNPNMMIINFVLILIGLALLSMCFNLIQAALERLLDRLLQEYIEEIEKMAEIVTNDEYYDEEAIPLEFKMTDSDSASNCGYF